jgi:hypothetical protein
MTTEIVTESAPDEFRGVGGAYVICEDGVRRQAPQPAPEQPAPEQPATPEE